MSDVTKRVIIADASEAVVMYVGILMRRLGFRVIPAESGLEVLKLTRIVTPDLIILDTALPLVNGVETLKQLRESARLAHVPVLMFSDRDDAELMEQCRQSGCASFLVKPLDILKLYTATFDVISWRGDRKRAHIRVPYEKKVTLVHKADGSVSEHYARSLSEGGVFLRTLEHYALSLSEGGVYLRTQRPLPIGSRIEIELPLIGGETETLAGTVIYTKDVFGDLFAIDPGMAIQFTDVTPETTTRLRRFIIDALAGDLIEEQTEPVITADSEERSRRQH